MTLVINQKSQRPGKKGAVKKKAKRREEIEQVFSPKAQKKFEREADNHLIDLEETATARFEWANKLKELQDEETVIAINRMVMTMARIAGEPQFVFQKVQINAEQGLLRKIQYYNHLWITMRLLIASAEWDIRVANFTLPKGQCARCGKKVTKKAKRG